MVHYSYLIVLIILNLSFFFTFAKIAKRIGFVDKSNKFNNPTTLTSAGIIFYINLLVVFSFIFFFEDNNLKIFPIILYLLLFH